MTRSKKTGTTKKTATGDKVELALARIEANLHNILGRDTPNIIAAGEQLLEAQKLHKKDRKFTQWLTKLDLSPKSAYNRIAAATYAKKKSNSVTVADWAFLAPGVMYALATGEYRASVESEILKQIKAGTRIDQGRAKAIIDTEIRREGEQREREERERREREEREREAETKSEVSEPEATAPGQSEPVSEPLSMSPALNTAASKPATDNVEAAQPAPASEAAPTAASELAPAPEPEPAANVASTPAAAGSADSANDEANGVAVKHATSQVEVKSPPAEFAAFEAAIVYLNKLVSKPPATFADTKPRRRDT